MLIQTKIELDDKNGDMQELSIEGEYCELEGVLNFCIEFAGIEFAADTLAHHFNYSKNVIEMIVCDAILERADLELENAFLSRYEFEGDR